MISRIVNYLRSQVLGLVAIFIALGGTGYAAVAIRSHSIVRRDLARGAVGQRQLGKDSVGSRQLRRHAVTERALAQASVGSRQLRKGSVRSTQISPGAIGAGKLANGSVGSAQLAAGSVGSGQLAPGSVGTGQLAAGSVTPAQLGGIASYTFAFAIVSPTGVVDASDPAGATTSGWSGGSGTITFPGSIGIGNNKCTALSSAPDGNGGGGSPSPVDSFAFFEPGPTTTSVQVTADPTGSEVETVVWVECAN